MCMCVCAYELVQRLEGGDWVSFSLSVPLMQHLPLNLGLVYLRLEARPLGDGVAGIHRRLSPFSSSYPLVCICQELGQ